VFSFIAAEKTNYPVAVMCGVFGVNRTGFHNWERRAPSDRALQDAWLTEKIKQIHDASRGVYGAPRIHAELRMEHNMRVGRKRVARLMKAAGISGVRPRKRWKTTIRIPGITPATDLVERQFRPTSPNVVWVADITYLRTGEGWLYLAAVQDAYSRQIVGWSMATHMRSTLVVDALKMALARRRPGPGLIHHSDQGSQYVSLAFGRAARQGGIAVSMGSRGDAYDNAVAETFFATLKKELVNRRSWSSRLELQSAVFEYIEAFYNRRRRHSTLGMVSPAEYEQTQTMETSIKIKQPTTQNNPGVIRNGAGPAPPSRFSLGLGPSWTRPVGRRILNGKCRGRTLMLFAACCRPSTTVTSGPQGRATAGVPDAPRRPRSREAVGVDGVAGERGGRAPDVRGPPQRRCRGRAGSLQPRRSGRRDEAGGCRNRPRSRGAVRDHRPLARGL
jgi:putative transposase